MARIAYRLKQSPGGGFHLGREGLDQEVSAETFPSDSLFGALCVTLLELEGAQAVEQFKEHPPRLSSAFPYAGDLLLFPMPRLRIVSRQPAQPGMTKTLKRLQYVSPDILAQLLSGAQMDAWLPQIDGKAQGLLLQDGKVWISRREIQQLPSDWQKLDDETLAQKAIWKTQRVPRVAVDRVTNSSQIYHVGRTTFAPDCGLWLLAEVDSQQQRLLDALLLHLGDRGLGGERSAGYGSFEVESIAVPRLPDVAGAPRAMTLSRYNPTREELQAGVLGETASYELVDVGGWLASPDGPAQRRRRVRMIEAGSVLQHVTEIVGRIVDVRPQYEQDGAPAHPVWRSGIALIVGVSGGA